MISFDRSIEDLRAMGVIISPAQIEYFEEPENRPAVCVFGVPDPDRLYIAGPMSFATIYQRARAGEPADDRGYRACVVPTVLYPGAQEEELATIENYWGEVDLEWPSVAGFFCDFEWGYQFEGDEIPGQVAVWDLWPIPSEDIDVWTTATSHAWTASKMEQLWTLADIGQGGEPWSEELARLDDLLCERQGERTEEYAKIEVARQQEYDRIIDMLISDVTDPETKHWDPAFPALDLPPEHAALWHSLQAMSYRNWDLLAKQAGCGDLDAPESRRFMAANGRICPWF